MKGLEEVSGGRCMPVRIDPKKTEVIESGKEPNSPTRMGDFSGKVVSAVIDNFPRILSIAESILDIKRMQVQSDAVLRQMEEQRKNLLAEAEAYAQRKNADTDGVVRKMSLVRDMMNDFYKHSGNSNISSEDFQKIISVIIMNMDKL